MKHWRIGYVPLTDAAVLVAAAERGFAEAEGIHIELVREVSWANIRDKLILGLFDAAHMLAPLAIATSLGLGHVRVPLVAPFALNLNGNAITLGNAVLAEMQALSDGVPEGPLELARLLGRVVARRRIQGKEQLVFATVFPYSTHAYLLAHWLRWGGIDPERDVQLVVVPPPYMAESLRNGLLHGFCVGSPWNSLAVDAGLGEIAVTGVEIARSAPEKVLTLTQSRIAHQDDGMSLLRALRAASRWCADRKNVDALSKLLAEPRHLGVSAAIIRDTLVGELRTSPEDPHRRIADFMVLGGASANRPNPDHAKWLYLEMAHAGQTPFREESLAAAAAIYRPELYDAATDEAPVLFAGDPIGLSAGPAFSAHAPLAYLRALRD
jgi:NitT/TauT family transport system ATP-binding protein